MAGLSNMINDGITFNGNTGGLVNFNSTPTNDNNMYNSMADMIGNSGASNSIGWNTGTLGAAAGGLQGLSGLAQAYMGMKNLELAKSQFKFQKGLANRNLANQSKIINNTYDNAAQVAAGMVGGRDYSGNFGFTDQSVVDSYAAKAKNKHVDGSSI